MEAQDLKVKPSFVYGSLMTGLFNHDRVADFVESASTGVVDGVDMYGQGTSYPYAIHGDASVIGEVLWIKSELYATAMLTLDHIENYRNEDTDAYKREVVTVTLNDDSDIEAWMYVGSERTVQRIQNKPHLFPHIDNGDWRSFSSKAGW
jgi:gamma-glutamylcyclotransferase (GGCT)/AIG2-like uncharacterized protein YtfP